MKAYLFVDRDGTLVAEPPDEQVDALAKIRWCRGVIPALLRLRAGGYTPVMVSNQDGLGTPAFPLTAFTPAHEMILDTLESQGVTFEQVLICPHRPEDHCGCRKPQTGLVHAYLTDPNWDRARSYVIGDRQSDAELAANMGLPFMLHDEEQHGWERIADEILCAPRTAEIRRQTRETDVSVRVNLDAPAPVRIATGLGFFDHMLEQIAVHAGFSLELTARGDLQVDAHHTVEDCAIALGQAVSRALGDKRGLGRFGFVLPMDEVYAEIWGAPRDDDGVTVALDLSGRPHAQFNFTAEFTAPYVGQFPSQMTAHFFSSLAVAMGLTLHLYVSRGNAHHQIEALFKAFGRALRPALARSGSALPSSKGVL